jgi:peptidoglycan/LPS O-acetylase OafA/YrhL
LDRHSVLHFWGQRAFRIYPAMWAAGTLGLWYLVALHWQIRLTDGSVGAPGMFRLDRFNSLFIAGSFTGMVAYILPQLWSIHVEILGSLAMPAIAFVALHRSREALWMLMVLAVTVSYIFGNYTIYHSALFFMDFVVGAALAVGALNPILHNLPASRLLIVAGLVGLSLTRFLPIADYFSPTAHLIETVLAALVIGLLAEREAPKLMRSAPLRFIGKISYSIYLLFFVVMCIIAKGFAAFEIHEHITVSVILLSILLALCTFVIVVPLAWLSVIYVEQPGIRLGRTVLARWQDPHTPPRSLIAAQKELPI